MSDITFAARWREELVATTAQGALVFEFTMGRPHVYFPSEARWAALAPPWARARWSEFHAACHRWCAEQRVPFSVVDDAHVSEETPPRPE